MPQPDEPVGQPFSLVYLSRSKLLPDSRRFRIRLGALFPRFFEYDDSSPARRLRECGLDIPHSANPRRVAEFIEGCDLPDALDTITHVYRLLVDEASPHVRQSDRRPLLWLARVRRILAEEGLAYRVDDKCGIHPLVDTGFEVQRVALLQGLGAARYKAARTYFESALAALEERPPDTRAAVKHAFDAAEQIFMMFAEKNTGLAADTVRSHLRPAVNAHYRSSDESQQLAASHMLSSFEQWVHAGHKYRHANKDSEPHEPSAEFAIAYISAAMGHLRWLAAIDQARLQPASA